MAYKPDIPQPTDILSSASQADLLANFQEIATVLEVNHAAFNTKMQGKHSKVVLPVVAVDKEPEADECSLFTKMVTVYTTPTVTVDRPELFLVKGDGDAVQITGGGNVTNNAAGTQPTMESGWTRLPSGLLLKWCGEMFFAGPYNKVLVEFIPNVVGPAFTVGACVYGAINLPGAAENKMVYPTSFDIATQKATFLCMPRYGAAADISNFYIDCVVIGV